MLLFPEDVEVTKVEELVEALESGQSVLHPWAGNAEFAMLQAAGFSRETDKPFDAMPQSAEESQKRSGSGMAATLNSKGMNLSSRSLPAYPGDGLSIRRETDVPGGVNIRPPVPSAVALLPH